MVGATKKQLEAPQLRFLLVLYLTSNEGQAQQDLSPAVGVEPVSIGRMVKLFYGYGLIRLEYDPTRHRSKIVYLSDAGKKVVKTALKAVYKS